jgi:hypothetical protein
MYSEMKSDSIELQELAAEIAKYLFTDGSGERAQRLVLELNKGRMSGGWSEWAVTLAIKERLVEFFQKVK